MVAVIVKLRIRRKNRNKYIDIARNLKNNVKHVGRSLPNKQYFYESYKMNLKNMIGFNTLFESIADKYIVSFYHKSKEDLKNI